MSLVPVNHASRASNSFIAGQQNPVPYNSLAFLADISKDAVAFHLRCQWILTVSVAGLRPLPLLGEIYPLSYYSRLCHMDIFEWVIIKPTVLARLTSQLPSPSLSTAYLCRSWPCVRSQRDMPLWLVVFRLMLNPRLAPRS